MAPASDPTDSPTLPPSPPGEVEAGAPSAVCPKSDDLDKEPVDPSLQVAQVVSQTSNSTTLTDALPGASPSPSPQLAKDAAEQAAPVSPSQQLAKDAAEQVLDSWKMLKEAPDQVLVVHGWRLSYRRRPHSTSQGDYSATGPNGQRCRSFQKLQELLGLAEAAANGKQAVGKDPQDDAAQQPKEARPPPIEDDDGMGGAVFVVQKLIERRFVMHRGKRKEQFLVRWKGYDAADDTWEDGRNIYDKRLVQEFDGLQPRWTPLKKEDDDEEDMDVDEAGGENSEGEGEGDICPTVVEESESESAPAICGTFGCTLPDKHAGLHQLPDPGARERRKRQISPQAPPPPIQVVHPRDVGGGIDPGTPRRRQHLSPSKMVTSPGSGGAVKLHAPAAGSSSNAFIEPKCKGCQGKHRVHTCSAGRPPNGAAALTKDGQPATGWGERGGGASASSSHSAGGEEDDYDENVPLGADFQAEVPAWVAPTSANGWHASYLQPPAANGEFGAADGGGGGRRAGGGAGGKKRDKRPKPEVVHGDDEYIWEGDMELEIAIATAEKLTKAAYLDSAELAHAMRSRGGLGRAGTSRMRGAVAAFPRDFFRYLNASDSEDDGGSCSGDESGSGSAGGESNSGHGRAAAGPAARRKPEQWQTVVRLELAISRDGQIALCSPSGDEQPQPQPQPPPVKIESAATPEAVVTEAEPSASSSSGGAGAGGVPWVGCSLRLDTRRIKLCGTMGCTLPDRHSGLCRVQEMGEPRKRRRHSSSSLLASPTAPAQAPGRSSAAARGAAPPVVARLGSSASGGRRGGGGGGGAGGGGAGGSGRGAGGDRRRPSGRSTWPRSAGGGRGGAGQGRGRAKGAASEGSAPSGASRQSAASAAAGGAKRSRAVAVLSEPNAVQSANKPVSKAAEAANKRRRSSSGGDGGGSGGGAKATGAKLAPGVYSVERLVDRRWEKNRWQYLVHWAGFSAEHDTYAPPPLLPLCCLRSGRLLHPSPLAQRARLRLLPSPLHDSHSAAGSGVLAGGRRVATSSTSSSSTSSSRSSAASRSAREARTSPRSSPSTVYLSPSPPTDQLASVTPMDACLWTRAYGRAPMDTPPPDRPPASGPVHWHLARSWSAGRLGRLAFASRAEVASRADVASPRLGADPNVALQG